MDNRYLFRGKRTTNGEWVIGNYCYSPDFPITIFGQDEYGRHGIEVDPVTVGQCAGKHDISGKEVFEGDIIESHQGSQILAIVMVIRYGTYEAYCPADGCYMDNVGFYVEAVGYPQMPLGPLEDYAKVIGNIFDNPDLMKEKMEYKCIKEMGVLITDENINPNDTYETVSVGSIWELDVSAYKLCGEVYMRRIDGIKAFKINITESDLENNFELVN